jgi:biofilm protein TabA
MILDTIGYAVEYRGIHPRLARAFAWLSGSNLNRLPTGRHLIEGEHLFAIVDEYTTRPPERCRLEAHRRYHDVQYIVGGAERIGYAPLENVKEVVEHDAEKDVAFFTGDFDTLTLRPGMFAVFGPRDAHAPQIAVGASAQVRKVVLKVELD